MNAYFASSEEGGWEDLSAAGCEQNPFAKTKIVSNFYIFVWRSFRESFPDSYILHPPDRAYIFFVSSPPDLLSNAFRTSSTKAPDALPSVKKWKAFAREIELLKLASSKKNAEKVFSAYASALEKLDDYLAAVELPSEMELKQM